MTKPNKRTQSDREFRERERWLLKFTCCRPSCRTMRSKHWNSASALRRRDLRERKRGMAQMATLAAKRASIITQREIDCPPKEYRPWTNFRRGFDAAILLMSSKAGPAAMRWARRQQK